MRFFTALSYAALPCSPNPGPDLMSPCSWTFISADQLVGLYDGTEGQAHRVGELRGNRIAAATSLVLARRSTSPELIRQSTRIIPRLTFPTLMIFSDLRKRKIESPKSGRCLRNQTPAVDRRCSLPSVSFSPKMPVSPLPSRLLVAFGKRECVCICAKSVVEGDTPMFVGDEEGAPVIVVNLTRSAQTSGDLQSRFVEVLASGA